jgi:hypothetical protein
MGHFYLFISLQIKLKIVQNFLAMDHSTGSQSSFQERNLQNEKSECPFSQKRPSI